MSKVAFRVEEAVESRAEMRREKKRKEYKFVCPSCGYTEYGGKVATFIKNVDPVTKKETLGRIHKRCPQCGTNMVKEVVK